VNNIEEIVKDVCRPHAGREAVFQFSDNVFGFSVHPLLSVQTGENKSPLRGWFTSEGYLSLPQNDV
jgi:hypothetical protein